MNILITGTLGVGKSHFLVHKIKQYLKEGREVYADLDELNMEGVARIPDGGWLACPEGSVVIYDEAQKIKDFEYIKGQTVSKNPLIYELADSRKRGYDIIFTTHQPDSLHTMLKGFIGEHYNVTRPHNRKESHIALWRKTQSLPNSEAALARAEDVFKLPFNDEYFKYYKSTVQDTHKTRIPKHLIRLAVIAIGCLAIVLGILFGTPMLGFFGNALKTTGVFGKEAKEKAIQEKASQQTQNQPTSLNPFQNNADAKAKAEQQMLANNAQNNPTGQNANPQNGNTISYDPSKPFATDYSQYQYTVKDAPHFTGCLATARTCTCYDQQGAKIEVSNTDCKAAIKSLPFNPFRDTQSQTYQASTNPIQQLSLMEQIKQANTPEQIYKIMNQSQTNQTPQPPVNPPSV